MAIVRRHIDQLVYPDERGLWTPISWFFHTQTKMASIIREMPADTRLF